MMDHVCGEFCFYRGAVDFQAAQRRDPRRYLLDGERLTAEEYYAHPRAIHHVEVSPPNPE
jgi:hypothetical protein